MKNKISFYGILSLAFLLSCSQRKPDNALLFAKDNLIAWCIVPFDNMERTPQARATMLNELGIKNFAYDWRAKHLPSFQEEIQTLRDHGIALTAVWLWVAPDSGNLLDSSNEAMLEVIRKNHVQTTFWVGFDNRYFEGLTDDEKLEKASTAVRAIHARANKLDCKISLYNHGDWFGEPLNEIKIIQKTGLKDIGIVYNFHHGHQQIDEFPGLLKKMLPYLQAVNIDGMRAEGPKILPVGAGNRELGMLKALKESGYKGPIGIIGHIEDQDVKVVLQGNIAGLRSLLKVMGDSTALATY